MLDLHKENTHPQNQRQFIVSVNHRPCLVQHCFLLLEQPESLNANKNSNINKTQPAKPPPPPKNKNTDTHLKRKRKDRKGKH